MLLWDVFRGHQDDEARAILKRNNIELVYISPNCTDQLQPLDQLVNKEFKGALKKEFQRWFANSILRKMQEKSANESVVSSINLKLSVLKPVHAQWLVCAVDTITEKKRIACKVIRNNRNSYVIGSFDFNLNVHYVRYFIDISFIVLSLCFFYHIHFEVNKLVKSSNHVLLL